MATLQNLRNRGPLLVGFVGIALFAFILSDLFKSNGSNAEEQSVGTLNEERLSAYEFEQIRGLFESVASYSNGAKANISEIATIDAWETLRDSKIAQQQAELLGIKVTQQDIDMWLAKLTPYQLDLILKNNTREKEMYLSTYCPEELQGITRVPAEFIAANAETGASVIAIDSISKYRTMAETGTAANKHESLLCNISRLIDIKLTTLAINAKQQSILDNASIINHAVAKRNFDKNNSTREIEYIIYPYNKVTNEAAAITDAEVEKFYNENKDFRYKNNYDARDVQVVAVKLTPSENDKMAIREEMNEYLTTLQNDSVVNYYELSLISQSELKYDEYLWTTNAIEYDIISNKTKQHFTDGIKNTIATAEQGVPVGPFVDPADMTDNIFVNIEKMNIADEYTIRFAIIASASTDSVKIVADSVLTALNSGVQFSEITKSYFGLDSLKFKADEFAALNTQLAYSTNFIITPEMQKAIYNGTTGVYNTIEYGPNAKIIYQVLAKTGDNVAYKTFGIKRTIMVSPETRDLAYNDLSRFITECDSIGEFATHINAFPAYDVNDDNITLSNINGTRDILAWVMNDNIQKGKISNIFDNGNNLLIAVGINNVYNKGHHSLDREVQPNVTLADMIKMELTNNKKAEVIMAELNGKNFDAIKGIANVTADSASYVEYASPVSVMSLGSSEPVISAVAANLNAGETSKPVKGNAGVYVVKVLSKADKKESNFDIKAQNELATRLYGNSGYFFDAALNELYNVDNQINTLYKSAEDVK